MKNSPLVTAMLVTVAMIVLVPMTHGAAGDVEMVSATLSGEVGDTQSLASDMTPDGRYVAFQTYATNLTGIGSPTRQICLKDMLSGKVTLISTNDSGDAADAHCGHPEISADGRYVAFHVAGTNLLPGLSQTNEPKVFRKDLQSGELRLVSATTAGVPADSGSRRPRMSDDGRYIVFESWATNLPGSGNFRQIYRKDMLSDEIVLVSATEAGVEADAQCGHPFISTDGRYVVFHTPAANMDARAIYYVTMVYRKDMQSGELLLVSSEADGTPAEAKSKYPCLTPKGRYVTFYSWSTNLDTGASSGFSQVFRKDMLTKEVELVSKDSAGIAGNADASEYGASFLSADGRYVCFISTATNLAPGTTFVIDRAFRKDMQSGDILLASSTSAGVPGDHWSWRPSMTPDGRYVLFFSDSSNMIASLTNDINQVYMKELPIDEEHAVLLQHRNSQAGLWLLGEDDKVEEWKRICDSLKGNGWILRDVDDDKVLLQQGDGGRCGIWTLGTNGAPVRWAGLAGPMPGWIARSLDNRRVLMQKGTGGAAGIWALNENDRITSWKAVSSSIPGWILRSLDHDKILLQNGDGGRSGFWRLDANDNVISWQGLSAPLSGWIMRCVSKDNVLLQNGETGLSGFWSLDEYDRVTTWQKLSNPINGWSIRAVD